MLLRQFLDMEHEATIARCLKEGMRVAESLNPDVVFLDVGLPDGSGLDAIGGLKNLPGHPEVIIVTGRGSAGGTQAVTAAARGSQVENGLSGPIDTARRD